MNHLFRPWPGGSIRDIFLSVVSDYSTNLRMSYVNDICHMIKCAICIQMNSNDWNKLVGKIFLHIH